MHINRYVFPFSGLLLWVLSVAQGSELSISPAVVNSGGTATFGLPLTVTDTAPAGLQWKIAYSPAQISGLSVTSGPAATAAVKTLSCSSGSGAGTCLLAGLNGNTIQSGVVAYLNATMAPGVSTASIQISSPLGTDAGGNAVSIASATNSQTINVTPAGLVSGVTCNPTSLGPGATGACTVSLSQSAPAGGSNVALSSDNSSLAAPSSVTIAEGATTANFSATAAGSIANNQSATVTATLGGISKSATVDLVASALVSAVACDPFILGPRDATTCTVNLTSSAGSGGAAVTLKSDNGLFTVPASVTVAEGETQVSFAANASYFRFSQNAIVTAALNGSTATASLTLMRH